MPVRGVTYRPQKHNKSRALKRREAEQQQYKERLRKSISALEKCADDEPIGLDEEVGLFEGRKPECVLCRHKIQLDYKNPRLLSQFISGFTGRLYDRHITGLCQHQHDKLRDMIMVSRKAGYMPIFNKEPQYLKDPKLFDPMRPVRPNPF